MTLSGTAGPSSTSHTNVAYAATKMAKATRAKPIAPENAATRKSNIVTVTPVTAAPTRLRTSSADMPPRRRRTCRGRGGAGRARRSGSIRGGATTLISYLALRARPAASHDRRCGEVHEQRDDEQCKPCGKEC